MSEELEIRTANPDDYDAIIKLFDNQDKEFAVRYYKVFFNNRNCCPHDEVFVRVVEGKIVGVIGYCPDRLETDDICWLGWFYVRKDFRGYGYGRELLDYVIDILENKPVRKLYVDTSSFTSYKEAMALYEKTGFVHEGTLKDYYEKGEDQLIFGRSL
jgi:ribosomal protein S18 acetylase RimI-like enzyme